MPITHDDAVTAVWRACVQNLRDSGKLEEDAFDGFLVQIEAMAPDARQAFASMCVAIEEGDDPELIAMTTNFAYFQALQLAMAGLMLLAHFPRLDQIAQPLPTGDGCDA